MAYVEPHAGTHALGPGLAALPDRRRPGRPAAVSPELLPLLRGQWREPPARQEQRNQDDLHALRGVIFAALLSLAFWLPAALLLSRL